MTDSTVTVDRETYQTMASLIRGWDAWLMLPYDEDDVDLRTYLSRETAGFCGSEAGARMEEPLFVTYEREAD